jgi:propanol-preferring alcohol dehydrogenase
MRAVRLIQPQRPLELHEIPIPTIDDYGVLVRVKAAGICHSDAHYRAGTSPAYPLPLTLGHEVAGVVERVGGRVTRFKPGDRVCLHYMLTCGNCYYCTTGNEQFCDTGKMIGHYADGGYADFIAVNERSVLPLPAEIGFEPGATLMCASATALHALRKGRLKGGESVAVIGAGGLGMSAVQLAKALGARQVFAIDLNPGKLALAEEYGAHPIDAARVDPVAEIKRQTGGRGVDVALELIGLPQTMGQALRSLAVFGRAVIVGISAQPLAVDTYHDLLGPETELIGSNDHLLQELPLLLELARSGALDTRKTVSRTVPLEAGAINAVLDELEQFKGQAVRTVIVP